MVLNEGKTLKLLSGKFSFLVNVFFFFRQVANCMENIFSSFSLDMQEI